MAVRLRPRKSSPARCRTTSGRPLSAPARSARGRCRPSLRSAPATARYYTPSGKSIQAKGIVPDIEVVQDVPDELKSRTDTKGEASLRGHLKVADGGDEKTGSQSYVPPDAKDDKALKMADDLLHGVKVNPSPAANGDKAANDTPATPDVADRKQAHKQSN